MPDAAFDTLNLLRARIALAQTVGGRAVAVSFDELRTLLQAAATAERARILRAIGGEK